MIRICIDPGHGGNDSGALGPSGTKESDIVLEVGNLLRRHLLPHDIAVFRTREDDTFVSLPDRVRYAHSNDADLFISIHANSAANPTARGFECFTSHGETPSDVLAEHVLKAYDKMFPLLHNRGHKEANFYVLTKTRMPAILFELEFIHNASGELFLLTNIDNMARALFNGVMSYLESQNLITLDPTPDEPPITARAVLRRDINAALNKYFDAI